MLMGMGWRTRQFVYAHRHIYAQPVRELLRIIANQRARRSDLPVAYVFAEPMNAGDYASYRGVRLLAGLDGTEYFGSTSFVQQTVDHLMQTPSNHGRWGAVFVGGGGLLQGCFDPLWSGLVEIGAPLVVFGVGVNRYSGLRNATSPELIHKIQAKALCFRVRDNFTAEYVKNAAGSRPSVGICPSVNYLRSLRSPRPSRASHLLHAYHDADLAAAHLNLVEMRNKLIRTAMLLGLEYDETNHLGGLSKALLYKYQRAAIVVSSRLHGCIFSLALSIPFVALALDEKIPAFIETHAQSAPLLRGKDVVDGLTPGLLSRTMAHALDDEEIERKLLENEQMMNSVLETLSIHHSTFEIHTQ